MKTLRALFSTMRRAARLDVYALNDLLSSERFRWAEVHPEYKPRGVLYCILKFFYKLLKSTKTLGRTAALARSMPPGAVLAFVTTSNQWDAIRPVTDRLDEAVVVGAVYVEGDAPYPLGSAFLYALPFFPIVFFHYLKAKGYKRLSHRAAFHEYWAAYGHYVVAVRLLRRLAPSAVLVANDHVMWTRTLVQAAREQGIPTCYLQHASVTENFPPLSFDYAFLDGADALVKYDAAGPSTTRVFLTGTPKFDRYYSGINTNDRVGAIGICTNLLDPVPRVRALCAHLRARFPDLPIVLRPHPGDKRQALWQRFVADYGLALSDSKNEHAFAFLQRIDAIVAGDSNVLLEAALMDVFALYYDFSQAQKDYYGFIRNGLVAYTARPEEVEALLRDLRAHKPSVRARSRYYCATVETAFDGRSAEVTASLIRQIVQGGIDETPWQAAEAAQHLDAFELGTVWGSSDTEREKGREGEREKGGKGEREKGRYEGDTRRKGVCDF